MSAKPDLSELLDALDPQADLAHRHLWLIALLAWVRGNRDSVPRAVARVTLLLDALQQRPETRAKLQTWWQKLLATVDATSLLADYGFASRSAFASELTERLRLKWLPGTPETADAASLFALALNDPFDAQWINTLDQATLERLAELLQANCDHLTGGICAWVPQSKTVPGLAVASHAARSPDLLHEPDPRHRVFARIAPAHERTRP